MKQSNIFNLPAANKKQINIDTTKQRQQFETKAKIIALGLFGILLTPMIIKTFMKNAYTSLIIAVYWILVIGIGLFFMARFIKQMIEKNKVKTIQKDLKSFESKL